MKKQIIFANKRTCFPFVVGGDGYLIHNVLSHLAANGYDVIHLSPLGSFQHPLSLDHIVETLKQRRINFSIDWNTIAHGPQDIPYGFEVRYQQNGYRCYLLENAKFWDRLESELEERSPKLVMTSLRGSEEILQRCQANETPAVLWIVDADEDYFRTLKSSMIAAVIFDSPFLKTMFRSSIRCPSYVIPPIIDLSQIPSRIREQEQQYVTIINPRREKGREIFLKIARSMPHIDFLIQLGWNSYEDEIPELNNISLLEDTGDLSRCLSLTKLLLVCSICEDAFPSVIPMAHQCGIPVVGSNRGGIPTAIGKGGIVIDQLFETKAWADAIERLQADKTQFHAAKVEALKMARRTHPVRLLRSVTRIVDSIISRAFPHH